jgi:hypothetical protein
MTGARTLVSSLILCAGWCTASLADGPPVVWVPAPPPPGMPPTCDRFIPLPPHNPGCTCLNLPGTGKDDPWRPPKVWPQTKYPVVPAYTRPSYGYFETSWRVLSVCGAVPAVPQSTLGVAPPPVPTAYAASPTPIPVTPPRNPATAPQPAPAQVQPPETVAPTTPLPPRGPVQTGPPKATAPVYPLKPRRPQTVAPAPGQPITPPAGNKQGALEYEPPIRNQGALEFKPAVQSTPASPDNFEMPDIAVRPF